MISQKDTLINDKSDENEAPFDVRVLVTSGTFEIPCESDGSLSLAAVRAQMPGASGLWFWSEDQTVKKAVQYVPEVNKLIPPDTDGWGDRIYNVSYSTVLPTCVQKEDLERYEIASRLLQQSIESLNRLSVTQTDAPVVKTTTSYQSNEVPSEKLKRKSTDDDLNTRDLRNENKMLTASLNAESLKLTDLKRSYDQIAGILVEKNQEITELKSCLETKKNDFNVLAAPSEGFGDPQLVREIASLKKELSDSKWKCGELENNFQTKTRECAALHDWKHETEQRLNRLQTDHAECNARKEKLEATIHALHQFALIMKSEADSAKKRPGIHDYDDHVVDEKTAIELQDRIDRMQKDLDLARDNLQRQSEEIDNYRWKCNELETTLGVQDEELALKGKEALHRERVLLTNLDSARLRIKLLQVQHHGYLSDDDDEDEAELKPPSHEK